MPLSSSVILLALSFIGISLAHPILEQIELADHQCDKNTTCSNTGTCCPFGAAWGCCPHPEAICCPDKLHCCPKGYTCDAKTKTCAKSSSNELIDMVAIPASPATVICGDGSSCPGQNTCCKLEGKDGYGCCPMSGAVCCTDGLHCCPTDYACNSDGTCTDYFGQIMMKMLTKVKSPKIVMCKDNKSECPDGNTCCKLASGKYGCCPIPSAVCCSDGVHCCPNGYTCDVSAGTCMKKGETIAFFEKIASVKSPKSVTCPDGQSSCPDGNTCCKLKSGYGCCPIPSAVCCSDGVHCCPNGYTCDVSAGTCMKKGETIAFFEKIAAVKSPQIVMCSDNKSECPDGNTCCKLASGKYGCCPIPNAVCCSDGVHCCPEGYTCDVSAGTCMKKGETIAFFEKIAAVKSPKSVTCPDGQSECADGKTCCKLASGKYGCCPIPNAVCCSDGVHCCPEGYTCDVSAGTCMKKGETIAFFEKIAAVKSPKSVTCPDGQSECADGKTCCKLASGEWGCCPIPNAVCCSDGVHCCPEGYTCDVSAGTCMKKGETIAFFEKIAAVKSPKSVTCPDGQSECADGKTCCKLASGEWGCCPIPNAVCCSDGVHCCPEGNTCDVKAGTCTKKGETIAFFEKIAAVKSPKSVITCPDGQSSCPDGNTCCKLASGEWGCCPIPDAHAVCCSDQVHCCPEGNTCDVKAGTCTKKGETIAFFEKIAAVKSPKSVTCPDGQSSCPDGNTCCKLKSGQWGCCPIPTAVCCTDGVHCCPNGYTCDVKAGTCSKKGETIAFFEKIAAVKSPKGVICLDGQSECPDGNTCCKSPPGQYGCCPLANAVCCSDQVHCCPNGYTCDVSGGTCNKKGETIAFFEKISAQKRKYIEFDHDFL